MLQAAVAERESNPELPRWKDADADADGLALSE